MIFKDFIAILLCCSFLKKHTQLAGKKEKMMTLVLSTPLRGCSDGENCKLTDMNLVHQVSILSWIWCTRPPLSSGGMVSATGAWVKF